MSENTPEPAQIDTWTKWFYRGIQGLGVATWIYEVVGEQIDRVWLLILSVALMIGGTGMELVVRAFARRIER